MVMERAHTYIQLFVFWFWQHLCTEQHFTVHPSTAWEGVQVQTIPTWQVHNHHKQYGSYPYTKATGKWQVIVGTSSLRGTCANDSHHQEFTHCQFLSGGCGTCICTTHQDGHERGLYINHTNSLEDHTSQRIIHQLYVLYINCQLLFGLAPVPSIFSIWMTLSS